MIPNVDSPVWRILIRPGNAVIRPHTSRRRIRRLLRTGVPRLSHRQVLTARPPTLQRSHSPAGSRDSHTSRPSATSGTSAGPSDHEHRCRLLTLAIAICAIASGGFVAVLDAALAYHTVPRMGGQVTLGIATRLMHVPIPAAALHLVRALALLTATMHATAFSGEAAADRCLLCQAPQLLLDEVVATGHVVAKAAIEEGDEYPRPVSQRPQVVEKLGVLLERLEVRRHQRPVV